MNKLIYKGQGKFAMMFDVPKEPTKPEDFETIGGLKVHLGGDFGYDKAVTKYTKALDLCKQSALEVINPEVLPKICCTDDSVWWVDDGVSSYLLFEGDIFDIPENVEFELFYFTPSELSCSDELKRVVLLKLKQEPKLSNDELRILNNTFKRMSKTLPTIHGRERESKVEGCGDVYPVTEYAKIKEQNVKLLEALKNLYNEACSLRDQCEDQDFLSFEPGDNDGCDLFNSAVNEAEQLIKECEK